MSEPARRRFYPPVDCDSTPFLDLPEVPVEIRVQAGDIASAEADVVVVNLFEGITSPAGGTGALDRTLQGRISQLIEMGDVSGKRGQVSQFHTFGAIKAPRVAVLGLGKSAEFDIDAVRNLTADLVRRLRKPGITSVATLAHGAGIAGLDSAAVGQAIAEGALLGSYRFDQFKSKKDDDDKGSGVEVLTIIENDTGKVADLEAGIARGIALAQATNFARDLANTPANHLFPTTLAERAREMAQACGLEFQVLEEADMRAKGMGSLLSVANGSDQPAKLVRVSYHGRSGEGYDLALVGKGITFDTGGISIKPAANMDAMKADMTGAASVIAAMQAIAALKPAGRIVAIAPCTENMPGGKATRPGDVVTAMNGKTIEILNTDAEGRLVLADAICWANELGARHIVDVATLTGAVTQALGDVCYAVMTNNDEFASRFEAAAKASGEKTWRLPMFKEYDEFVKSDVADIKNVGSRGAGTIMGGKFIEQFAGETPWVHLDIAGMDSMPADAGWICKGVSGVSVRPMINLALTFTGE
jgi:leucyl aminopeptidase